MNPTTTTATATTVCGPVAKGFTESAERCLRAARLWITRHRPYYSKALFACRLIPSTVVPTLAIDDRWRIYVNSGYIEALDTPAVAGCLIHELNHALRSHTARAKRVPVPAGAADIWNVAADCEINDDLRADGIELPEGLLYPTTFGLYTGETAERYYNKLIDKAEVVEVVVLCGSGCSGHATAGELGDTDTTPDNEGLTPTEQQIARHAVAQAVREHHRTRGSTPEGLQRWADEIVEPAANWRRVLASALRRSVHLRAGAGDYTWQRPSRRPQHDNSVIRAAVTRPVPDIAVVVDTSASMGTKDLARATTEINAILTRVVAGESIRVYSVDADVASVANTVNARRISLYGGGGTDMRVGIAKAAEAKPAAIVVITDGYTPWPTSAPRGSPIVVAALTESYRIDQVPAWITVIDLEDHLDNLDDDEDDVWYDYDIDDDDHPYNRHRLINQNPPPVTAANSKMLTSSPPARSSANGSHDAAGVNTARVGHDGC